MRVAIIGTRFPSIDMYDKLKEFSYKLSSIGVEISTGGAIGIDTAAIQGISDPKLLYVYLSDDSNKKNVPKDSNITIYDKRTHYDWNQSVRKYHPSRGNLAPYAFALHARNYGIIMDPNPVDAVIALPKSFSDWGGTGQGMRIALDKKIKLYNILKSKDLIELEKWINMLGE